MSSHTGTFAANMGACIMDYVCKVLSKPVVTKDDAARAVLAGVIGGFGGCLSTVSTWVVEVGVRGSGLGCKLC